MLYRCIRKCTWRNDLWEVGDTLEGPKNLSETESAIASHFRGELDLLRDEATDLEIDWKGTWGKARLKEEIDAARWAKENPTREEWAEENQVRRTEWKSEKEEEISGE